LVLLALRTCRDILKAIKHKLGVLCLMNDRDFALKAVQVHPTIISSLNDRFRRDREIMLLVLQKDGRKLYLADNTLASDDEFVMETLKSYPGNHFGLPPQVPDRSVDASPKIGAWMREHGFMLTHLARQAKGNVLDLDKQTVIDQVSKRGLELVHACEFRG
jgi:hypothetical protein